MDKTIETVYLAGKITGDSNFAEKFNTAAHKLERAGFVVLNPAILPENGFTYDAYIRMTAAMLDECSAVCFLPDWTDSKGAMYEYGRAVSQGKDIFHYATWVQEQIAPQEQAYAQ